MGSGGSLRMDCSMKMNKFSLENWYPAIIHVSVNIYMMSVLRVCLCFLGESVA